MNNLCITNDYQDHQDHHHYHDCRHYHQDHHHQDHHHLNCDKERHRQGGNDHQDRTQRQKYRADAGTLRASYDNNYYNDDDDNNDNDDEDNNDNDNNDNNDDNNTDPRCTL